MDWDKYSNYFTTNANPNTWATVEGFGSKFETHNTGVEFDDIMDNVVADVEYVELESIPCICNKCKYSKNATVININYNNKHEELLCDYNDYTKSVNGGKTKCRHFELREEL